MTPLALPLNDGDLTRLAASSVDAQATHSAEQAPDARQLNLTPGVTNVRMKRSQRRRPRAMSGRTVLAAVNAFLPKRLRLARAHARAQSAPAALAAR